MLLPISAYRTQKMKGICALLTYSGGVSPTILQPLGVIQNPDQIPLMRDGNPVLYVEPTIPLSSFPLFARPCPVTPRHGFVESRVVKNWTEVEQVCKETWEADPLGEIMLVGFIQAEVNAIWTPTLLTVGAGHDGATAGKNVVTLPLCGKLPNTNGVMIAISAGGVNTFPYIESVTDLSSTPVITQLRDGPKLDSRVDFIPSQITVKEILTPDPMVDDLLVWESKIKSASTREGVVVYHPGGSPSDHFSIHARTFSIPVCITFEPKVGETLTPLPMKEIDYPSVVRGLVAADKVQMKCDAYPSPKLEAYAAVGTMLLAFHNSPKLEGDEGWWVGVAAGLMLRYGCVALCGEARHLTKPGQSMLGRGQVYTHTLPFSIHRHRARLGGVTNILRYGFHPGGIGGIKWAQCGASIAGLFDAVGEFVKTPNKVTYGGLVRTLNVAVNQAHNGGWWLNKFIAGTAFNQAQNGDLCLPLICSKFIWKIAQIQRELTQGEIDKRVEMWSKWTPSVNISHPKILSAAVEMALGDDGTFNIKIKDRILKDRHIPIRMNAGQLFAKIPEAVMGSFYLRSGPDGLALDLEIPNVGMFEVWREDGLKPQATPDSTP